VTLEKYWKLSLWMMAYEIQMNALAFQHASVDDFCFVYCSYTTLCLFSRL